MQKSTTSSTNTDRPSLFDSMTGNPQIIIELVSLGLTFIMILTYNIDWVVVSPLSKNMGHMDSMIGHRTR